MGDPCAGMICEPGTYCVAGECNHCLEYPCCVRGQPQHVNDLVYFDENLTFQLSCDDYEIVESLYEANNQNIIYDDLNRAGGEDRRYAYVFDPTEGRMEHFAAEGGSGYPRMSNIVDLSGLDNVRSIGLSHNDFTSMSGFPVSLNVLGLTDNKLYMFDMSTLPNSTGSVYLDQNNFYNLYGSVPTGLNVLILDRAGLTNGEFNIDLPDDMAILNMDNNYFQWIDFEIPNLEIFSIKDNLITLFDPRVCDTVSQTCDLCPQEEQNPCCQGGVFIPENC